MIDFRNTESFVVVGATTGQVIASQVGGIGVVGGFGGMALGTPVIVVGGAIAGAAIQGIIEGIETGDVTILGVTTVGSVLGAGFSAAVGNVGVGIAGSAFGVGLGTMAATGGLFALGVYQLIKMFTKGQSKESVAQTFERMEDRISGQEFYNQAMMELDPALAELAWLQKMAYLEVEEELQTLKATIQDNLKENSKNDYVWHDLANSSELEDLKQQLNTFFQEETKRQTTILYDSTQPETETNQIIITHQQTPQWTSTDLQHFEFPDVTTVAIAPNNQYLFSGNSNGTVHFWDLQTQQLEFTFIESREEIQAIAVTPDSNQLLAAGFNRRISAWNIQQKSIISKSFSHNSSHSHEQGISALAISPDGQWVASGSRDQKIKLWGRITGQWERNFNGHSRAVSALAFTPDSQMLISASEDQTICLWSVNNSKPLAVLNGHSQPITCLKVTANGRYLFSSSLDGKVNIWDLADQKIFKSINTGFKVVSLAVREQLNIFAIASFQEIQLWNWETGELIEKLEGCHPIAFGHDGQMLISGSPSQKVTFKIWRQTLGEFDNNTNFLNLDSSQEWWTILGVSPDADSQEVKLAYYYLAKQLHPDQNNSPESIRAMQIVNEAYARFRKRSKT